MKYEEAFEKLNKIKEELEKPEISLDEAINLYNESAKFTKTALDILKEAEGKITVIKNQLSDFVEKPFVDEE